MGDSALIPFRTNMQLVPLPSVKASLQPCAVADRAHSSLGFGTATLRALVLLLACAASAMAAPAAPAHLPGEVSADDILNGSYIFPASPVVPVTYDASGFAKERLSKVPAPGIHPRLLLSPEDLPGLRRRLKETSSGRALYATLQGRLDKTLRNPADWGSELYGLLSAGDAEGAQALVKAHKGLPPGIGHYQPYLYAFVLEAFDALLTEDQVRGKNAATAIATYAQLILPGIEAALKSPLGDDVWRAKVSGPVSGTGISDQGMRDGVGGHLLGYGYDFAHPFMTEAQRSTVRGAISKATYGQLWMGARLPHHFRNWNWIAVGLQQPLLALSIEGEEGFDPRVYKMGVEIARDYLSYGISPSGMSTEAVGYTQFGFVWGNPFIVAAARRGDNLLTHSHHRAMIDWYLHSMEPSRDRWTSHGDGGDSGPSIGTLMMWRYHFPEDPKISLLWRSFLAAGKGEAMKGPFHIIEPLLWCFDEPKTKAADPALPLALFDPVRSSLIARSSWSADATLLQFECRTDSVGASHEHSDRGAFTFSALGRSWAKENFRSVETRHHNSILIDGLGQGFWPGPGTWLEYTDAGGRLVAACDAKAAYDWFWPKQILWEQPDSFVRFGYARWDSYRKEARDFRASHPDFSGERDTRPSVVAHWKGFEATDPRMWDEDGWPVRSAYNPVKRAFRSMLFERGKHPFVLVIDDIQKDDSAHLYEWLMQTGLDTAVASIDGRDIVLCDESAKRDAQGQPKLAKGDRKLLVRVLELNTPTTLQSYSSVPSFRLEAFERKDTLLPEVTNGALSGARSFGLDKRLVIASRSVAPDFKILLYPLREGEALPITMWNADRSLLTVARAGQKSEISFSREPSGRTRAAFVEKPGS